MHSIWCLLVSAGVPRMTLCSSLSVVAHMICRVAHQPEFNFFRPCSLELRAFAVVRYVCVALVPSHQSHHASHTRKAFRRERIACVCIRCCSALFSSVCWTERSRACGARAGTGRFIAHARVFRNVPRRKFTSFSMFYDFLSTPCDKYLFELSLRKF